MEEVEGGQGGGRGGARCRRLTEFVEDGVGQCVDPPLIGGTPLEEKL